MYSIDQPKTSKDDTSELCQARALRAQRTERYAQRRDLEPRQLDREFRQIAHVGRVGRKSNLEAGLLVGLIGVHRVATLPRVQLRELSVVKKSGRKVPFDRDKLARSVQTALRKRPVDGERVERLISGIVRQLESSGETDVPSELIGRLVMDALRQFDDVAYVRFASVYRDFREAKDFESVIEELKSDPIAASDDDRA